MFVGEGGITRRDCDEILAELAKVRGFDVSYGDLCTAVEFDGFVIAIVGGHVGVWYFIAYLIRIPGRGWTFLETKEVPEPFRTRAR